MRIWTIRILLTLIVVWALAYVADWAILRIREHTGSAYGSVMVNDTDAIKDKGGRVEYFVNPPQPTSCVHSLFPHEGQASCWWLARHSDQQKFMN